MNQQLKLLIKTNFGVNPLSGYNFYNAESRMDDIRRYHNTLRKMQGGEENVIDDITWEDLEMDRVFLRINHTNSFIGEQVLFHKLHILDKAKSPQLIDRQEKIIDYLDANPTEREGLEAQISYIGKHREAYHLIQFLVNSNIWKIGNSNVYHLLQAAMVILIVGTILFHNVLWISGLVGICLINLFVYTIAKMKYEIMFNSLSDFKGIFDSAKWIANRYRDNDSFDLERVNRSIHNLKKMSAVIISMNRRRKNVMSGDIIALFFEYVWGMMLIDLSMYNYVLTIIDKNIEDVICLLEFIGEIDSDIAVLSYRHSVSHWCKPTFNSVKIEITDVIHPLISNPVANSFVLDKRAIITGANASGKSTFMKSVAINTILALSINTCLATSMNIKPVFVITCMSLRDDIVSGESYYFREAKYLKRMLDIISENQDVFIVIDEILKGTNTEERIAASRAILEYVSNSECFALVATHDRELTKNSQYMDYYFSSSMKDSDIHFDYKIHEGTNASTNAIDLLSYLGYPISIVNTAERYMDAYR